MGTAMERYQALSQALSKAAEREEAYWQGLERRLHELPDCFTRYLASPRPIRWMPGWAWKSAWMAISCANWRSMPAMTSR